MGEFIFKNYAPSSQNIGLHFEPYDSFIHPPIIKDEIINANPKNLKHITVYLPSFDKECLEPEFGGLFDDDDDDDEDLFILELWLGNEDLPLDDDD